MNAFIDNGYTYNPEFRQYSKYTPARDWQIAEAKHSVARRSATGHWYGANQIGTSTNYRAYDGKMVIKDSHKYLLNYPNGKSTTFFTPYNIEILRRTKSGALLQTVRNQKGKWYSSYQISDGYFRNFHLHLAIESGIVPANAANMDDEDLKKTVFPLSPGTNAMFHDGMLAMESPRALTEHLFGKSRYRKDLMKAIGGSMGGQGDLSFALIATAFRGLVPIDWIINWLREEGDEARHNYRFDNIHLKPDLFRKVLLSIPPANYRRLLNDKESSLLEITDIVRMYVGRRNQENLNITHVRSFKDLHDQMQAQLHPRRVAYQENVGNRRVINWPKEEAKSDTPFNHRALPGIDLTYLNGEYTYALPETAQDLYDWGQEASNCIGSYEHAQRNESSQLLVVRKGTKMVACMELRRQVNSFENEKHKNKRERQVYGYQLSQLLGRFNQTLTDDVRTAIVSDLEKVGVDTSGSYWGSGR